MATSPENTDAELKREREDPDISPAQPLGADRIDDDNGTSRRSAQHVPAEHVKADHGDRMEH